VRVLHVSPTWFSDGSVVGGAERYVRELARASAERADVTWVSFGARAESRREGPLRIEILRRLPLPGSGRLTTNPLSRRFAGLVRRADVVHCHQPFTLSTDVALVAARLFRKKAFVTDLGGGHRWALSKALPLLAGADALLLISDYSRRLWAEAPVGRRPDRLEVIWGGVDPVRFSPGAGPRTGETLFVGRLLPHKGVDYLVEAMPPAAPLRGVGRPYDSRFLARLETLAAGRDVTFETAADDATVVERYRTALVTVLPSVYDASDGRHSRQPELLGLVVLESMACGTPAIVTRVASLPEIVEDGVTGFVVPPNDPGAIREKILWLRANPDAALEMGRRARAAVLDRFTWPAVVARCLDAYAGREAGAVRRPERCAP
jgi:glycosyltransferase involved in cell wall biosynthesis